MDHSGQANMTDMLRQIAAQVKGAQLDREEGSGSSAVTVLFVGPCETGKSVAARTIARELGLPLHRIDLSQIVSKYIGETEKNLDRIFHAAGRNGGVLFLDEADALFGKRSEVKDAHDRYANVDIDYLLERMEAHDGLIILTTNRKQALDDAFLRRLRFIVEFPLSASS